MAIKKKIVSITLFFLLAFGLASNAMGQWMQTNGPARGRITAIASNGSNMYAGTYHGVFLSTNNGNDWKAINTGLPDKQVEAFAVKDGNIFAVVGGVVFVLTNNGTAWLRHDTGLSQAGFVNSIAATATCLLAGTNGSLTALYRSTDNGATWMPSTSGITTEEIYCFFVKDTTILAGTYGGHIFRSTNDGVSWKLVDSTSLGNNVSGFASIGNDLFVGESTFGVFRSNDDGISWEDADSGYTLYVNAITSIGKRLIVGTYGGVIVSDDEGKHWAVSDSGFNTPYPEVRSLGLSDTTLLAGTDNGVFISTDKGLSWNTSNNGMADIRVYSLATDSTNLYAGTDQYGVFASSDKGDHWKQINNGLKNDTVRAIAVHGSNLYVGTIGGHFYGAGVWRSTDAGLSWSVSSLRDEPTFAITLTDSFAFAGTYTGVYRSGDSGTTWIDPSAGKNRGLINALASIGPLVFGSDFSLIGLARTSDNGVTWTSAEGTNINPSRIYCLAVKDSILYAGGDYGMYVTTDYGDNWTNVNNGLPQRSISIKTIAISDPYIFAGTDSGVFVSKLSNINWIRVNSGLSDSNIHSFVTIGTDLFAATDAGVWHRPLSDFIISDVKSLTQPNHNIFISPNPSTGIIAVHNAPSNMLHITITNVLGETVSEAANPSAADFTIDLSKLPAGMYYARFVTVREVITRNIVKE